MMAGVLLVLLLAALGMPLFAVIAAIALLGFHAAGYDLVAVAVEYYRLGDSPLSVYLGCGDTEYGPAANKRPTQTQW